jgi:predicted permease
MTGLLDDLRDALRHIRRRPVQSMVAVGVLAIGLSAGTAAFTYINAFSQPFPGVQSDGLVRLFGVEPENSYAALPYEDVEDYREAGAFQDVAIAQPFFAASVRLEDLTEVGFVEAVTGNFFTLAGVDVSEGRGLLERDDTMAAEGTAVISYAWWQELFGGRRDAIGMTIHLNYRPFVVVGVASPRFVGTTSSFRPDVWIPMAHFRDRYVGFDGAARDRNVPIARAYARLAAGESSARAMDRVASVANGLDESFPRESGPRRVRAEEATWIDPQAREDERATVNVMLGASVGLLLLVCANVANLLLAIATGRRRELATRAAIGASPARLLRQSLLSNVVLALGAGAVGLGLAGPLSARLGGYFAQPSVWADNVPRALGIDARVAVFALLAAVLTGLLAGLAPGLRASRTNIVTTLKSEAGGALRGRRRIAGVRMPGATDLLVTAQVALSVVLLSVAGLVVRTLRSTESIEAGFPYQNMIASHISTSSTDLQPEERGRFFEVLAGQLETEPWVRRVAVADNAVMAGQPARAYRVDGQPEPVNFNTTRLIAGFFEDFGVEVLEGRAFSPADSAGTTDVAIVNRALVTRYYADESPLGRRVTWPARAGAEERSFEIVGVVGDYRSRDILVEPEPTVFLAAPQHPWPTGNALHVTTTGDPAASVTSLQRWLREYESYLAIVNVIPYREVIRGSLYAQRMNAELFSVLASLALALAAIGVFSVLSLAVGQRTREIGIRMAIGARRASVGGLMLKRALVPVGLGLAIGFAATIAVSGLVRGLLYGVEPTDPVTLLGGLTVLVVASLAAAWVPARRATRVDPIKALRPDR